ncbi:MAG TPA: hypothetical protein VH496_07125 [Mycobacterium sp.]|jgi:hypothetical protein
MTIRRKYTRSLLTAGAVAAAVMSAPVAGAQPVPPNCQAAGNMTTCSTSGSVSIKSAPAVRAPLGPPAVGGNRGLGSPANPRNR